MFKRKKKKTGVQTPEFRKPTPPPPPPTSGSNAAKPNPNYVPPASVKSERETCPYELPCGWCTKWDKKCDKKIGCGDDKPQRGLRAKNVCINCENKEVCKSDADNFLACWAHNFEYFKAKENDND